MTLVKNISGLIPGFMSLGVVGKSIQVIPTNWGPKGVKKVKNEDMIKSFTKVMIGIPVIKQVSTSVAAL